MIWSQLYYTIYMYIYTRMISVKNSFISSIIISFTPRSTQQWCLHQEFLKLYWNWYTFSNCHYENATTFLTDTTSLTDVMISFYFLSCLANVPLFTVSTINFIDSVCLLHPWDLLLQVTNCLLIMSPLGTISTLKLCNFYWDFLWTLGCMGRIGYHYILIPSFCHLWIWKAF
jgi:hypothetical protein